MNKDFEIDKPDFLKKQELKNQNVNGVVCKETKKRLSINEGGDWV